MAQKYITRNDEMILVSIFKLGKKANLVALLDLLNKKTEKKWTIGNLFVSLEKLETNGYISGQMGEPTKRRGGRAIRLYTVSDLGINALKTISSTQDILWEGVKEMIISK